MEIETEKYVKNKKKDKKRKNETDNRQAGTEKNLRNDRQTDRQTDRQRTSRVRVLILIKNCLDSVKLGRVSRVTITTRKILEICPVFEHE